MVFSFAATANFDFLTQFSQHIRVPIADDMLTIPASLGEGYIRRLWFGKDFKITLHRYTLKEDFTIRRSCPEGGNDLITMFFYSNEQSLEIAFSNSPQVQFSQRDDSAIQVTSNDLSSTICFPANRLIHYAVVGIMVPRLKELLSLGHPNGILQTITERGNSFLFFEGMTAEVRLILKNMGDVNLDDDLGRFYMQNKVQELLYLLFHKLSQRENIAHQRINSADAERLLLIRNEIISDLSVPPVLKDLAQLAAMSETKLKQLFKQTFGASIYNYFQQARMEEAAFLLKQGRHTVGEVGYELGFSNLSHFSRLFEKHYGLNPKRFAVTA